ncbi:hypothetical protein B0A58_15130 [Flavobacterium branchiophilum NBRC 15030 = ATCC 35035]|uniref:Heterokaryon incompatibility protein Het-C n=1 Tax=Flavobacterium branchiophilum TaxID=55197 RepID=A0A543G2A2_9FLAO|nr:HET-C-related protein [Flavobacterium branchiophilum]OXA69819.1 hypothetical protein B0A58_15130 [Flavobacterium branchiophilum NBRC 15030 = ATCC 35035]TQM40226.1 heterokaryon incompatibility protein Het-C [Flavobacterium branchiophilum]GEM55846.1 hypothetical protein FB1_20670 [Flavobacterium branchiophilum NBRC 15030 = ATCC 35035]
MTKVRTSGGKITVTIGGDFKTYAKEDIIYNSQKTISFTGKENGITHGNPENLEFTIEESEDYKLESKFALEQLFEFAKKDSKAMFCFWMADIFGSDIPLNAYEQLYKDASDKKDSINPKITVAKFVPGFGATYYSGIYKNGKPIDDENKKYKNHIIISEDFITKAIDKNLHQKLLMIALVEEFGHHLDYLLRYEYSKVKGDASKDEGAKYTAKMNRKYKRYLIDPFKVKEQHYATATIKKKETKLIWDFADLNEKLNEYVDNRTEKDDNYFAGFEFFGAGMGDDLHGLGHQAIEKVGLEGIFDDQVKQKIYLGNWMRDFSQFVDPMVVRPMANALDAISEEHKTKVNKAQEKLTKEEILKLISENNVTINDKRTLNLPININITEARLDWELTSINPVKLSREGITSLVELLAVKEFGQIKNKGKTPDEIPNYDIALKNFRKNFLKITPDVLGVYRPEEHIDNPAALVPKSGAKPNLNNQLDPAFVKDPNELQYQNSTFGTKNYIRGNGSEPFPSAYDCFKKYITSALSKGPNIKGFTDLGAALHILEDLYAHSNFSEIAVMKVYDPEVFPWVNLPTSCKKGTLKDHKADFSSNKHVHNSVIKDRSKINYNVIDNPELQSNAVKKFLKYNPTRKAQDYYNAIGSTTENKGLYYSHAECAPLVTGSFGPLDTLASIAPKINNKIFSITVEEQESMREGERTFTDSLIYELLKDISGSQAQDTKEKNAAYKGTDDNKYSETFKQYLLLRDAYVSEHWYLAGFSFADVLKGFGIFDYITQYVKVIQSVLYHFLSLAAINLIDDYQTLELQQLKDLENGTWKVDKYGPTHTQLAKDKGIQPLHHLAVLLAENAIRKIGFYVNDYWEKKNPNSLNKVFELADEFFRHPGQTSWADQIVYDWCKQNLFNKGRVLIAHEASVVIYGIYQGHREVQELFDELYTLNFWNSSDDGYKTEFDILFREQAKKWNEVQKRLFEVWQSNKFIEAYKQSGKSDKLDENKLDEKLNEEKKLWETKNKK